MTVLEKLDSQIKEALKTKNADRLGPIRMIKAAVKNKEIELIRPLLEQEFFSVLATLVKRHRESIEHFKAGNRSDLVLKEEKELKVVESFLPQAFSETEIDLLLNEAIVQTAAKGPKDMGLVMKYLKEKTTGRVDGKILSDKVRARLS